MSWISDVKYELNKLDVSIKSLRKFGITIGLILAVAAVIFIYLNIFPPIKYLLLTCGLLLLLLGVITPKYLQSVYKYWMGIAFILGWFISRFLLSLLFIFVLTPISLIAKLVNKRFLNLSFRSSNKSHWVRLHNSEKKNYEKMY